MCKWGHVAARRTLSEAEIQAELGELIDLDRRKAIQRVEWHRRKGDYCPATCDRMREIVSALW